MATNQGSPNGLPFSLKQRDPWRVPRVAFFPLGAVRPRLPPEEHVCFVLCRFVQQSAMKVNNVNIRIRCRLLRRSMKSVMTTMNISPIFDCLHGCA